MARVRLSNDPLMIEGVVTLPYTDTLEWVFDERRVVWVQVKDGVGNWSEPYPAYAGPAATCDLAGGDGVITVADVQAVAGRWREESGTPYDRDGDNRLRWPTSCGMLRAGTGMSVRAISFLAIAQPLGSGTASWVA